MSTTLEQGNGQLSCGLASNSSVDSEWLKSLNFRTSAPQGLREAASQGNVNDFISALIECASERRVFKKSERLELLEQLRHLREATQDVEMSGDLATALFEIDLKKAERSGHVEAFIAEHGEEAPDSVSLTDAIWILAIYPTKLENEALFSLWRWTLQKGREWMESKPVCDAEQGFSQLRFLEVCYLMAVSFENLKGSRSLLKETTALIRNCVEEATDNDGTPQAHWVPTLIDSLSSLGRIATFNTAMQQKLINKAFGKRLQGLFERACTYCARDYFSLSLGESTLDSYRLDAVGAAFQFDKKDGIRRLIQTWQKENQSKAKVGDWSLPEMVHQSDWSQHACMRSNWSSPVDLCLITHEGAMPRIDLVIADHPLLKGDWGHEIRLDGKSLKSNADWACTCWFADDEVNYMELVQEIDASTRVSRQIILLREEHQLVLNHVVVAEKAGEISSRTTLPIRRNWIGEADTTTRELALENAAQRVRIHPLSLPQEHVVKADGKLFLSEQELTFEQHSAGSRLISSIVLDWSPKHLEKPVEWGKLTVAQDGRIETTEQAAAFRFRVGRDQWLLYHSMTEPDVPRSVLGLHTSHETVLSKITSRGEIEPIIEVEI